MCTNCSVADREAGRRRNRARAVRTVRQWSSRRRTGPAVPPSAAASSHAVRTIRIVDHAAPRGRTADPLNPKSDPRQARPEPGVGRRANKDGFLVQRNCGPYRFLSTPEVQKWTDLVQMIQSEHETNRDLVIAAASVEAHGEGSWAVRSLTRKGCRTSTQYWVPKLRSLSTLFRMARSSSPQRSSRMGPMPLHLDNSASVAGRRAAIPTSSLSFSTT